MTLPSSGSISFLDIKAEYSDNSPVSLNEYYAGGGLVPVNAIGSNGTVPSGGQIGMDKLRGTSHVSGLRAGQWLSVLADIDGVPKMPEAFFGGKYYCKATSPSEGIFSSSDLVAWDREYIYIDGQDRSYDAYSGHLFEGVGFFVKSNAVSDPFIWVTSGGGWSKKQAIIGAGRTSGYSSFSDVYFNLTNVHDLSTNIDRLYGYHATSWDAAAYPTPVLTSQLLRTSGTTNDPWTPSSNLARNASGSTLLVTGSSWNAPGLVRSTDGGVTWNLMSATRFYHNVVYNSYSNRFYASSPVSGGQELWYSASAGSSWTKVTAAGGNCHYLASVGNILVTGFTGASLGASFDGGITWEPIACPGGALQDITGFSVFNNKLFIKRKDSSGNPRVYSITFA